jgi:NTE family protein
MDHSRERQGLEPPAQRRCALLLTGGGARAAYQVGVLQAICAMRRVHQPHDSGAPFDILVGTSAGAINAAALACGLDEFDATVEQMASIWSGFEAGQVYGADLLSVLRSGARWMGLLSMGWVLARFARIKPKSLLDNTPLAELLQQWVPLERLPGLIERGTLRALAVTASSYQSGRHITFFQGAPGLEPWVRSQRLAVEAPITHTHLLASSAIPFVFPAQELPIQQGREYFGDGSMRQTAPVAPAIHLGAEKVLVIGAGRMSEPRTYTPSPSAGDYPSLAQIAGHALSSIFLDALSVDIERVRRINQTLHLVPPDLRAHSPLRPVELMVIAPTQRLDSLAAQHADALPAPVRSLLGALGVSSGRSAAAGGALASYLLFEAPYTQALMALGAADAWAAEAELCAFLGWSAPDAAPPPRIERRRDPLRV